MRIDEVDVAVVQSYVTILLIIFLYILNMSPALYEIKVLGENYWHHRIAFKCFSADS